MTTLLVHELSAGTLRHFSIVVFTSQEPSTERRPNSGPDFSSLENVNEISLEALPIHHVVLALLNNRRLKSESLCHLTSFLKFGRGPLRSAPEASQSLTDQPVERADNLFHTCVVVGSVRENDIHVIELQSFQRLSGALDDSFARKSNVVGTCAHFD